jgi:hypothetical protein
LIGRKPIKFSTWLFEALGMLLGDDLDDIFPGTGGVAAAWAELSSGAVAEVLPTTVATVPESLGAAI